MRSGSTFLLKISLLCCVWCYCFGNNKQKTSRRKSEEKKHHSSKKITTKFPDPGSSTKLNDSNMQGSTTSIHIENETKGYVNPDFYIPYIDSENDNSNSLSILNKKKNIAQDSLREKTIENMNREEQLTKVSRDQEGKTIISIPRTLEASVITGPENVAIENELDESRNSEDKDDEEHSRSNCSSVKSSDFVVVLETARKNEEEIAQVRNSYYEKLAEAVFIPISVEDELVKETMNFQTVTEELRRVGERYLIKDIRPSSESCHVQTDEIIEPLESSSFVLRKSDSPDSGLASGNEISHTLEKLIVSTSGVNSNLNSKSTVSPNQYNSKSSDCLKKLEHMDDLKLIKWRSAEEPKNFGRGDPDKNDFGNLAAGVGQKRNSEPMDNQVVTTTIVQTGTTTLTQVSKRFSGSWKEFEIKTRRVVRSNSRTSNSSSDYTDDLKDLHVTVQSEQGESKVLVDETSRVVSQPHDNRVAAEYLTNLSHMLIDDCRKFHKDSSNGSKTPSECSEYSGDLTVKRSYNQGYTYESHDKETRKIQKTYSENFTAIASEDDKTLSGVIASIAHSLASNKGVSQKAVFDINGNKPTDDQIQKINEDRSEKKFRIDNDNHLPETPISSTLVISLHLSPNNLVEQDSDLDSPPCKTTNQWYNGTEWVNFEDNVLPKPDSFGDAFVAKREKLVIIRETYRKQESKDEELKSNGEIMTKLEASEDEAGNVEDINIRRAREAAAFAQRYFQQGHKT